MLNMKLHQAELTGAWGGLASLAWPATEFNVLGFFFVVFFKLFERIKQMNIKMLN